MRLTTAEENIQGKILFLEIDFCQQHTWILSFCVFHFFKKFSGLQATDMNHNEMISALEGNGGSQNSNKK